MNIGYSSLNLNSTCFKSNQVESPRVMGKRAKTNNPTVNKWMAGICSAVSPGLGQITNGESKKAKRYMLPAALMDILALISLGKKKLPIAVAFLAMSIVTRTASVVDAVKNANNYADPEKAKNLDYNA